jgi:hypothetical protein
LGNYFPVIDRQRKSPYSSLWQREVGRDFKEGVERENFPKEGKIKRQK